MSAQRVTRRRVKVRGGDLGAFLCWSVVFADIGTSIYYVPGILSSGGFNKRSTIFVLMTLVVFVLLSLKYAEVTWRNPEGGGVVTISSRALHPFAGLVGGLFIVVDYYLTAALSAFSGVQYLAVVAPWVAFGNAVPATLIALGALAVLNIIGIKESARISLVAAALAALGQVAVVAVVVGHLGLAGVVHSFSAINEGPPTLTPLVILTGFGAAFLAFSGLESVAQIAPAMRLPRNRTAYRTMGLVILTMTITAPLLTLWQTTLVHDPNNPNNVNQLLSLLGGQYAGNALAIYVAVTGSVLLVFASNTAIIGGYHVFLALTRMGFLPRVVERHNALRRTPHIAILAAVLPPVVLVYLAGQTAAAALFLGDLYAFGLLGSFILTNLSLDVVRWREMRFGTNLMKMSIFVVGVITTLLVVLGWSVNLFAKPYATVFGGGLTAVGLAVGIWTYRRALRRRPTVFPVPFVPKMARESIELALGRNSRAGEVLVILPHEPLAAEAVITEATRAASGRGAVFLYRSQNVPIERPGFLEVADPYLRDYAAHDAFSRAELIARNAITHRRYVYMPGNLSREVVGDVWRAVHPKETLVTPEDHDVLPPLAFERVHRHHVDGTLVLHMFTPRIGVVSNEHAV